MRRACGMIGSFAVLAMMVIGCGRGDGPELAAAGGTVTYKGRPLEGANVVFMPDSGPAAYGTTDASGKFIWMTRDKSGAMVSSGKVVITATEPYEFKSEEDLTKEDAKKLGQSLIPVKYGRAESSGLTATVKAKGENQFPFDLTD